jgi:HTH-type transcriptional regulator/antitoxin HipB
MNHFSSKELKGLRKAANLSQKELGSLIGISRETVVAIENEYPGTIDKLSITVMRKWWNACKSSASKAEKKSFKATVLKFFEL